MKTIQTMRLIMTTYPGFHDLPKGVKKMLLVSESHFFDQTGSKPGASTTPIPVVLPLPVMMAAEPAGTMARAA